jgi:hypothetical protein
MKNPFRAILILGLGLSLQYSAAAKAAPTPSTEQLMRLLIQNQSLTLDVASPVTGCHIETSLGTIRTLGEYLAHLTSALIPDNGQAQISSTCKTSTDIGGQACEVWFSTGSGTDSPWRYGVQFRLNAKGQLVPASLRCPGAS